MVQPGLAARSFLPAHHVPSTAAAVLVDCAISSLAACVCHSRHTSVNQSVSQSVAVRQTLRSGPSTAPHHQLSRLTFRFTQTPTHTPQLSCDRRFLGTSSDPFDSFLDINTQPAPQSPSVRFARLLSCFSRTEQGCRDAGRREQMGRRADIVILVSRGIIVPRVVYPSVSKEDQERQEERRRRRKRRRTRDTAAGGECLSPSLMMTTLPSFFVVLCHLI